MTNPLYVPTNELVTQAWLRLASGVWVDTKLPAIDDDLRENGAVRIGGMGGTPNAYVPMHAPVVFAECWVPPDKRSQETPWLVAAQLAQRLWNATFDPALRGVDIDLSTFGDYSKARVHDVIAVSEPQRLESDPTDWARYDLDLAFTWTAI